MWSYDVPAEDIATINTPDGLAVLHGLHRTSGKEIWVACRPSRQRMFHQGRTCQAEPWPQVLAGKGACADCESYYLDFLVHQTVLILAARAKAQRITPAPAARAGNHPGGAHESNSRASHDLAA